MPTPLPALISPAHNRTLQEALAILDDFKRREPEQRRETFKDLDRAKAAAEALRSILRT